VSERDFVMDPAVIRSFNRTIRAAFRQDDDGGEPVARILVADDEPGVRARLQELLEQAGYAVATAANGLEALELQRDNPVDLVITDIFMPELDGLETIAALRRDAPEVKIIAISSDEGPEGRNYLRAAESFGAVHTFTKPVRADDLLAAIEQLLERDPQRDE